MNYERILVWCLVSGGLAIAGGLQHDHLREILWLLAVGVDLGGSAAGFFVPGLGRSITTDWNVEGHHMAERCQSFVLIALGESIVVIGAGLASGPSIGVRELAAIVVAFAGSVGLWWVYFDRTAEVAEAILARHPDPASLGRTAYHTIHPVMIGGIVAIAAGDHAIVSHPDSSAGLATAIMMAGGSALFLAGHALFKLTVWNIVSWSRVVAVAVLLAFIPVAAALPDLLVGAAAAIVVLAVAFSDPFLSRRHERSVKAARNRRTAATAKNR